MQVFILTMVMALLMHDQQGPTASPAGLDGWRLAAAILAPKLIWALLYAVLCRVVYRGLMRTAALRWVVRLNIGTMLYRGGILVLWGLDLFYLGLLTALRATIGDLVLLDEMLALSLPIAMLIFGWWADYPIDRRLREATLMRSIDAGLPIQAIWTRSEYLLGQVRHQLALMLVPLLVLLGWLEAIITWAPPDELVQAGLSLGGAGVLFLFAPLVIRRIWDTIPLPPGELREMLVNMCRQHRVAVRELLLWRTFGGLLNAAVMGVIGPLRYILLTDALLESLPLKQVEAVMAHEIAHVRRHHMFWLLIVAAATSTLLQTLGGIVIDVLIPASSAGDPQPVAAGFGWELLSDPELTVGAITCFGAACWLLTFGWVSRRFERQADTFAVQHLVQQRATTDDPSYPPAPMIVDAQSVGTMVLALEQVSRFNHMATTRRSWRHGSIAWRQAYLNGLIGLDVKRLPIDRQIFWIKCAAATVLTATIALTAILHA